MAVLFEHDGKSIDLDDVPLDIYMKIEKATDQPWWRLTSAPQLHAESGVLLAKECAQLLGVTIPDPLTPRLIVDLFRKSDDPNRPTEYDDGLPDPKAEGSEPETT